MTGPYERKQHPPEPVDEDMVKGAGHIAIRALDTVRMCATVDPLVWRQATPARESRCQPAAPTALRTGHMI